MGMENFLCPSTTATTTSATITQIEAHTINKAIAVMERNVKPFVNLMVLN